MLRNLLLISCSFILMAASCNKCSNEAETPPPPPPTEEQETLPPVRGGDDEEAQEATFYRLNLEGQINLEEAITVTGVLIFLEPVEGQNDRLDIIVSPTETINCESQNHAGEDLWVEIGGEQGERDQ